MTITPVFIMNAVLLGVGLAMDAFSVSIANALSDSGMKKSRMGMIAGLFALFQFAMPMAGWICVHSFVTAFSAFQKYIPWIALALLLYIGGKMLWEGIGELRQRKELPEEQEARKAPEDGTAQEVRKAPEDGTAQEVRKAPEDGTAQEVRVSKTLGLGALLVQGVATSIDALSVGFTIADYRTGEAVLASMLIGLVTFAICWMGLLLGRKFGARLQSKATILGGTILIAIGLEIFIKGILG